MTAAVGGSRGKGEEGGKFMAGGYELDRDDSRKAKMLYDYDATNSDEISINEGQVC